MIEVEGIAKAYGPVKAVKGISFSIRRGEVVGLLGPNGAGKSTTMRMVTGFLEADAGTISIGGTNIVQDPITARAQIGYLPENAPLYHDMEVTDFLGYLAQLRQIPKAERKERIREMVTLCGLVEVVGRPIGQLSKGFRQRVGLAAAMLHRPPILILDEPTSGLDPNQIQEIRAVIREIGKERTVILSTHILQEVEAVCDRALIINRGELVGAGTIAELMTRGQGQVRYYLHLNVAEGPIRAQLSSLHGVQMTQCRSTSGEWNEATFETTNGVGGEDLFQWTVTNGWKLRELRREAASLEDVFRELTAR
jgi:ABC-2 type transport system ATP-binding protein